MAKKKKAKTGMRVIDVIRAPLLEEIAALTSSLAEAAKLLKSGEETIFENSKVVGQLNQELFSLRKEIAAEKTSVEFWIYEASRWRKEAEELRREDARARVARGER